MDGLTQRVLALVERLRAGEGRHVAADLGETLELWLTSGVLPMPSSIRPRAEALGALIGQVARGARPAPVDVPPPPEASRWEPSTVEPAEPAAHLGLCGRRKLGPVHPH